MRFSKNMQLQKTLKKREREKNNINVKRTERTNAQPVVEAGFC